VTNTIVKKTVRSACRAEVSTFDEFDKWIRIGLELRFNLVLVNE